MVGWRCWEANDRAAQDGPTEGTTQRTTPLGDDPAEQERWARLAPRQDGLDKSHRCKDMPESSLGGASAVYHFAEDVAGNDQPLNFTGSLADFADLGVPHHPLDRVVGGVPVSAKNLNGLSGGPHRELRAK